MAVVNQLDNQNEVDSVWIMGGASIYEVCINKMYILL
jgi:dihydrofolate reductase